MPYLAPSNDTKDNNKKWPTNNSSDSSTHDDKNTPTSTITHSSSISILYSSLQSRDKMSSSYDISGSDNVLGRRQQHKYETLSPLSSISPRRKSAPDVLKLPLPPKKTFNQQDDDQLVTIRKKSGEIVKSSLKKRSKSEPSTPLIPKYVHFNADLEQIRLFKEAREPQAVSADVSSDESDDDDDDDDFFFSDNDDDDLIDQEPLLTISIPNMPPITTLHSSKPVFVESIYLSKDKRRLEGRIMVQNIAFRKLVEVRYTFDFWQTVSEVKANYAEGVIDKDDDRRSFDVFVFSIELFDNSRNPIDGKIMYFAVHYNVCNRDYWDNNSGSNYQVNFKKIKNSSSSSSQCNHHCYHKHYQYNNNNNNNDNHKANRVSSSSSSNNNNNDNNNNSSSRWPIISSTPVSNRQKSLNNDCHSPPAPASSTTHTSITDPRKRAIGRYDIGTSLSAAQNIASFSSTNNNNNKGATTTTNKPINNNNNNNNSPVTTIMTTSPFTLTNNNAQTHANYYYHISKLTISCDPYGSFGAGNYIDGMPVTTETPLSSSLQWDDSPKGAFGGFPLISSNPIEIPSRKSSPINSTNNYYDHIISQYCFSSGSPYAISPSPFASSPSTIHL